MEEDLERLSDLFKQLNKVAERLMEDAANFANKTKRTVEERGLDFFYDRMYLVYPALSTVAEKNKDLSQLMLDVRNFKDLSTILAFAMITGYTLAKEEMGEEDIPDAFKGVFDHGT